MAADGTDAAEATEKGNLHSLSVLYLPIIPSL